ncbi:MAG: ferritin-like domain-containing protein [Pseudomonadota bacterium]
MTDPSKTETPPYRRLAHAALTAAEPAAKIAAAREAERALASTAPIYAALTGDSAASSEPPDRPARPAHPALLPPNDVPRRRIGSPAGRVALMHAVAHIELNAIDLAFDMAARFADEIAAAGLDAEAFVRDWFAVAVDEARHFAMIEARLDDLGSHYGALAAHDGLWEAALKTADSALARLAVAPMVLEARGLDVTPGMIEKLMNANDDKSADVLRVIYQEEIDHVRKGVFWFNTLCGARDLNPAETFETLVRARFNGGLKPPFNDDARGRAGFDPAYYSPFTVA